MLRQMPMAPSDDLVIESPSQAEHVAALELVMTRSAKPLIMRSILLNSAAILDVAPKKP